VSEHEQFSHGAAGCIDNGEYNVKLLCSNIANDGAFNICDSKNVTVRNSFVRVQSDVFANESEDIRCENCQSRAGRTEF